MSLFALFSLLLLIEDELLVPSLVVLVAELLDSVLGHFSLNVLAFLLACLSVLLEGLTVERVKGQSEVGGKRNAMDGSFLLYLSGSVRQCINSSLAALNQLRNRYIGASGFAY